MLLFRIMIRVGRGGLVVVRLRGLRGAHRGSGRIRLCWGLLRLRLRLLHGRRTSWCRRCRCGRLRAGQSQGEGQVGRRRCEALRGHSLFFGILRGRSRCRIAAGAFHRRGLVGARLDGQPELQQTEQQRSSVGGRSGYGDGRSRAVVLLARRIFIFGALSRTAGRRGRRSGRGDRRRFCVGRSTRRDHIEQAAQETSGVARRCGLRSRAGSGGNGQLHSGGRRFDTGFGDQAMRDAFERPSAHASLMGKRSGRGRGVGCDG